jgi:hypothetical protein
MNAALRDYRMIWRAATARREPGALRTLYLTAGAIGGCALILAVLGNMDGMRMLRLFVGAAAGALALVWAFLFIPGSVRMNSPINAWLLPRQRRRLLQLTTACWLLVTAAIGFAIGSWGVLPFVALATLGLVLMNAGNMHVAWLLIVGGNAFWLLNFVLPPGWGDVVAGDAATLALGIIVVPAAVWGLRWLYPAGGDAYLDRRAGQLERVGRFDQCGEGKQHVLEDVAWRGNLPFYFTILRRDLRRADPGAMLMHALGPLAHWTSWIFSTVALLVGGVTAYFCMLTLSPSTASQALVDWMVSVAPSLLALTIAFSTARYGQQLRRTQGEQALLRLTPLVGNAVLLNRLLARRMLRQALACWAVQTATVLCVTFLLGGDKAALLRELGLCCLAGQAAMTGLLGDYASTKGGWNLALGLRAAGLALVQALAAVVLGALTGTTAWPWLVVLPLAVGAILLRRDWRRMLAALPAFPANRMA